MDAFSLYERIGLKDRLPAVGKKLDKKMFYDYTDINRTEKNIITKYVEKIELSYLLTSSTINIQAYIDDEYYFEGVMFVTVDLRNEVKNQHVVVLEEVIHRALPNPVVITFNLNKEVYVSTCMKRLNKVNKNNVVLESIHRTNWFTENNPFADEFIQSITLSNISFTNFYEFYKDIDIAIKALQDAEITGTYRIFKDEKDREKQEEILAEIKKLEQSITKLRSAMKKESQFNKKVELNMQVQKMKKEIETLKSNF